MAADRIVLLGTGTCQLERERMASAVLLELGDLRIVFDFGRGVTQRLGEIGLAQDAIEHVVLSHFHADHFSDLIPYLHAASWSRIDPRSRDLHVYGPAGLEERLAGLLDWFPRGELVREERYRVRLHEIREPRFRVGHRELELVDLPPAGNHGLRFEHAGASYALTGDSHFHDQEIAFLRGAELGVIDAGHLGDGQIVELAVRSGARRVVCSHLYRELDERRLNDAARRAGYAGRLVVGHDLMTFEL